MRWSPVTIRIVIEILDLNLFHTESEIIQYSKAAKNKREKQSSLIVGCTVVDRYKWWLEASIDIGFWGSSRIYKYLVIQPLVSMTARILLGLHTFSMPVSYDGTLFNGQNSASWFFKIIHLPPSPPTSQLSLTHSLSTTPFHPYPYTPPPTYHVPSTPHHPSPLPQGTRNQIGSYRTGANKISHRWGEQTKKEYTNHTHVSAGHCMESVTNLNKEEVMVVSLIVFVSWIQRQDRM